MIQVCNEAGAPSQEQCSSLLASVGDALYAIGGKWTLRVIIALAHGHTRFNDIQRTVTGISARVLSNELKTLEMNGFLRCTVYASATPVVVECRLTDYSNTLESVVNTLSQWGAMHRQTVKQQTPSE